MKKPKIQLSLRSRFTILYILCILLPILVLNSIITIFQIERNNSQFLSQRKYIFTDLNSALDAEIKYALETSTTIANDYNINAFLNRDYLSTRDYYSYYEKYQINKLFDFSNSQFPNISAPVIFTTNPTIAETQIVSATSQQVTESLWHKSFVASNKDLFLYFDQENNYAYLLRKLHFFQNDKYESFLKVNIDLLSIEEFIVDNEERSSIMVFNNTGDLQYTLSNDYATPNPISYYAALSADKISNDLSIVFTNNFDSLGQVKLVISTKKAPLFDIDLIILTFGTMVFTLLAAYLFLKSMEKNYISRVENIVKGIDLDSLTKLNNDIITQKKRKKSSAGNELQIVEDTMAKMTGQIHDLVKATYDLDIAKNQAEVRRKQSELNALLSQINPHYLFNVLNAIRLKSIIKGEKETAKILLYVSKIFRQSITWSEDIITLGEEINFIKEYLAVEKYRFEDKLEYTINIGEEILGYDIPKMCLQPFVENACVHGVQNSLTAGRIDIDITTENTKLIFKISNPATTFSEATKNQILDYSKGNFNYETKSVGLKNTFSRLLHYYQDINFDIDFDGERVCFILSLDKNINREKLKLAKPN